MKDYRLPLWSTIGLLLILVLLLLLRTYERGVIAGVLGNKSSSKSDYARLLSKDKDAELKKNNVDSQNNSVTSTTDNATNTSTNTSTSLTINSGGNSTGGDGGSTPPPTGGGGVEDPPTQPFGAQIAGFGLRSQSGPFVCSNSGPSGSLSQMCKQYDFVAGVNTFNGPGTVNHKLSWRGVEINQLTGSFQAATGDVFTQVNYSVKLRCDAPGPYMFKFIITKPQVLESHEIPLDHNCGVTAP